MFKLAARLGFAVLLSYLAGTAFADQPLNPHGKPSNTGAGKVEHYAVWQDEGGWHIRTMTKEVDLEKDLFIEGPEHHVINFDFSTKGSIDGVDFRVKGKEPVLSFTLTIGEKEPKFEPGRIFVGSSGAHPSSNPFEIPAHGR